MKAVLRQSSVGGRRATRSCATTGNELRFRYAIQSDGSDSFEEFVNV